VAGGARLACLLGEARHGAGLWGGEDGRQTHGGDEGGPAGAVAEQALQVRHDGLPGLRFAARPYAFTHASL
jgi:hypothetical protein